MIILSATNDKLQMILAGAITTNQLSCMVSWRDITTASFTPGRTLSNSNGATDVDIVPSPDANTQRVIDFISVYNRDTAAATVTIKYNAGGTIFEIYKVVLAPGETLQYSTKHGWIVLATNGSLKTTYSNGISPATTSEQEILLANDYTNANAVANTLEDIPGFEFPVVNGGTYRFAALIWYDSSATTNGARFALDGATFTNLAAKLRAVLAATTETIANVVAYNVSVLGTGGLVADNTATIEGIIKVSADGVVKIRVASELAAGAFITVKKNSSLTYKQIA